MTAPPQGDEPRDYFSFLLTDNILPLTVTETSRFADELKAQNVAPKARIVKWKPLTKEAFLVSLGIPFHMGTIPLSRIADFWSTDFLFFAMLTLCKKPGNQSASADWSTLLKYAPQLTSSMTP
jgi:hypothetical protein